MLCLLNITFLTGNIFGISLSSNSSNVSALTYSTEQDISFTFAPSLSITLSDTDLVIDTLAPGNTAESNTITVSVASNTPYGYALYADVGSNDTESTYYNTSDLIRDDNVDATFTSIATNASLPALTTDNTWGYSTSLDNGTTWSTYNGLPTATSTDGSTSTNNPAILIDTKLPADSKSVALRVAARASTTQASGTYGNVINFYAVGKPYTPPFIQDTAAIKAALTKVGDETQVVDERDGKMYWVAKQADGNIWMTQNLDLCIRCEGTAMLTSRNTDINTFGNAPYKKEYRQRSDGSILWSPTIVFPGTIGSDLIVHHWTNSTSAPDFVEGGDAYVYTSNSMEDDTVYDSLGGCISGGHTADECSHYAVGDYYNYTAAIASSDSSSLTAEYTKPRNSICPAGWRLPTAAKKGNNTETEFGQLFYAAGVLPSSTTQYYNEGGFNSLRTSPLYFILGGIIHLYNNEGELWGRGGGGHYWTNTTAFSSGLIAYSVSFGSGRNYTSTSSRGGGNAIRCIAR